MIGTTSQPPLSNVGLTQQKQRIRAHIRATISAAADGAGWVPRQLVNQALPPDISRQQVTMEIDSTLGVRCLVSAGVGPDQMLRLP